MDCLYYRCIYLYGISIRYIGIRYIYTVYLYGILSKGKVDDFSFYIYFNYFSYVFGNFRETVEIELNRCRVSDKSVCLCGRTCAE